MSDSREEIARLLQTIDGMSNEDRKNLYNEYTSSPAYRVMKNVLRSGVSIATDFSSMDWGDVGGEELARWYKWFDADMGAVAAMIADLFDRSTNEREEDHPGLMRVLVESGMHNNFMTLAHIFFLLGYQMHDRNSELVDFLIKSATKEQESEDGKASVHETEFNEHPVPSNPKG